MFMRIKKIFAGALLLAVFLFAGLVEASPPRSPVGIGLAYKLSANGDLKLTAKVGFAPGFKSNSGQLEFGFNWQEARLPKGYNAVK